MTVDFESRPLTTVELGRFRVLILCLACVLVMPLIAIVLLGQGLLGSKLRAMRMCVALDQCANAATGGNEDETISSRSWRAFVNGDAWGWSAVFLIDCLFGKGHCHDAAEIRNKKGS